jgi:hypothetical protein
MSVNVYDKAKWHYEHASYPRGQGDRAAYLYGGFFLVWALMNGLVSEEALQSVPELMDLVENRNAPPTTAYQILGGALTSELFTEAGAAFAAHSFDTDSPFDYYRLFEETLAKDLTSPYSVADSWEAFERIRPDLDAEFSRWKERQLQS